MRQLSGRIVLPDGSMAAGIIRFDQTISALEPSATSSSDYILPGFIDLQVNGSHGIDVMDASSDGIIEISQRLAREGTAAWLPTAVTAPIDRIEKVHRAISEAILRQKQDDLAGARILGMHLEGPFISPMRLGAHPKLNLEPRGEAFERVFTPGMVFMAEPNPITADGTFGIFLGHTFIVTQTGSECVDKFPWELMVV